MTHEQVIRAALEAGKDPHLAWAAHSLGKTAEAVTPAERQVAKSQNMHLLYSTHFMSTVNWNRAMARQSL